MVMNLNQRTLRLMNAWTTDVGYIWTMACSADGAWFAAGGEEDEGPISWVRLLDRATMQEVDRLGPLPTPPMSLSFSYDATLLAVTTFRNPASDGALYLWDVATRRPSTFALPVPVWSCAVFHPHRPWLATAGALNDDSIAIWDTISGEKVVQCATSSRVMTLSFSRDGTTLLSGHADGEAVLWDATTGAPLRRLGTGVSAVIQVALSPDGRRAALGTYDGRIYVRDLETGKEQAYLSSLTYYDLNGLAFVGGNTVIAVVCGDELYHRGTLLLYELIDWDAVLVSARVGDDRVYAAPMVGVQTEQLYDVLLDRDEETMFIAGAERIQQWRLA